MADRFVVRRALGRGGMGEVYEADDMELRERVALKTLLAAHAADESGLARFRREIHLARRISHSNVCRVHDIFRHRTGLGEILVLSMELLDGETLSDRLVRGPRLDRDEIRSIARQVITALGAMHAASIIHRDLKSSNIMLVPDPREVTGRRAVVMDFGLARLDPGSLSDDASTVTGRILGTPAYLAPEQVVGDTLGPWTDVYAFGVALFEMACGRLPFQGNSPLETAVQRLNQPPPRPGDLVTDLPADWEALILRCLARRPEDRLRSADDVLAALGELTVDREDATVAPPRVDRRAARVRALAGLSVIVALVVGLTLLGSRIRPTAPASQIAELGPAAIPTDVSGLRRLSREALARGDLQGAYEALREAIRANPNDPELQKDVEALWAAGERLVEDVRKLQNATQISARAQPPAEASRLNSGSQSPAGVAKGMEAAATWAEADLLHKSGRTIEAIGALVKVHALLQASAPRPLTASGPPSQRNPENGSAARDGRASTGTITEARAGTPPAPAGRTTAGIRPPAVDADVSGVFEAIERYRTAYQSRDVSQVVLAVPSMTAEQVEQIRRTFEITTAYEIGIGLLSVQIEGDTAIARAPVTRSVQPRLGAAQAFVTQTEFRLRRDGSGWVISEVNSSGPAPSP